MVKTYIKDGKLVNEHIYILLSQIVGSPLMCNSLEWKANNSTSEGLFVRSGDWDDSWDSDYDSVLDKRAESITRDYLRAVGCMLWELGAGNALQIEKLSLADDEQDKFTVTIKKHQVKEANEPTEK